MLLAVILSVGYTSYGLFRSCSWLRCGVMARTRSRFSSFAIRSRCCAARSPGWIWNLQTRAALAALSRLLPRHRWPTFFVRRECLDHVLVHSERHLLAVLGEYVIHYNRRRPHQARQQLAPMADTAPTPITDLTTVRVRRRTILNGLINEYRQAA